MRNRFTLAILATLLLAASALAQDWVVKDSSLGGKPAEPLTVHVQQHVPAKFTFTVQYTTIVPQGKVQRVAGLRTSTHDEHISFAGSRIVDEKTIEIEVTVAGYSLEYMIDANILATQDPVQVHFGRLPLVVIATPQAPDPLPLESVVIKGDNTAGTKYLPAGDVKLGVRWTRLYEEEPAASFHVGRSSADPERQYDEALEPWDRRVPDTATIGQVTELGDKSGMIVPLLGLRQNIGYRLLVRYVDANGRTQMVTLTLSTKPPVDVASGG